jgi:chlorite dismutase
MSILPRLSWTSLSNLGRITGYSFPTSTLITMDLRNSQKETTEPSGLRLVSEPKDALQLQKLDKQFVSYIFLRVNPDYRKLNAETKGIFKTEFQNVYQEFGDDFLLFSYSLVGFDSKADLMFWRVGTSLDLIQEMTAKLYRTNLGNFLETADNYLSVTKRRMFVHESTEDRFHVNAGEKKYLFLYPCAKSMEWYAMSPEERDALVEEKFMVGMRFPNIKIHLTHSFGFGDQEYLLTFETDEPRDFLALAEELRQSPASRFTVRGMPVYTCRQRPLMECLDALG